MYNDELVSRMTEEFGEESMVKFAEMVSFMHGILYQEAVKEGRDEPTEHDFERDWWKNKFEELNKQYNEVNRNVRKTPICY